MYLVYIIKLLFIVPRFFFETVSVDPRHCLIALLDDDIMALKIILEIRNCFFLKTRFFTADAKFIFCATY